MVKCQKCNGRGSIGLTGKNEYGNVFYDFECDYCKGRGWVSEKKAEKYKTTFCSQLSNLVTFTRSCEVNARWKMSEEKLPHWIEHEGGFVQDSFRADTYECSECGEYSIRQTPYCPYCGAKMVGEQEVRSREK